MNDHALTTLANTVMPFGKYKGRYLHQLPENYLLWLNGQEIVTGKLKQQLLLMQTLKLNGLTSLLTPLIRN